MDVTPSLIHFDVPSGAAAEHAALIQRLGHPATICHGPAENETCPIIQAERACELISAAHGVVFELNLDLEHHRDLLARYRGVLDDDIPVRVITEPEFAARYPDLLAGVDVWAHEPTAAELSGFAARVEAADAARSG